MTSPKQSQSEPRTLACPYFMPVERLDGNWPHPSRLPLGGGWRGHCTVAGHEGEVPTTEVLETCCNLGYADGCAWAPRERSWDAVRFAVTPPPGSNGGPDTKDAACPARIIRLRYVCERHHRPIDHGDLEFDLAESGWLHSHSDQRLQKMAECFLDAYLKKRPEQTMMSKGDS